jgi:hypothetical protein
MTENLPSGLADMLPGPQLAAALDGLGEHSWTATTDEPSCKAATVWYATTRR